MNPTASEIKLSKDLSVGKFRETENFTSEIGNEKKQVSCVSFSDK